MRPQIPRIKFFTFLILAISVLLLINGCSSRQRVRVIKVKDNKPGVWNQYNDRIEKFYKKYNANQHVKISLKRAQRYLPYIHQVFRHYHLPPELAYLPMLESSFKEKATSKTGARGLWQFTVETGRHLGLRINWYKDERIDWKKSTQAAAKYLDQLGERFNYNWELALAAYNGGPNYISKQMKRQRTWNFWNLKLRQESSQYIPKFISMLHVAREKYPGLYHKGAPNYWVSYR